ncbi:hypothetical protein [Curtobacterium sp. MCSS17_015]|uniref:hypothetical protein n=1 Tax=Curtobacterium sp. MCSS17_015 TaxID=2175666 RepID=UPI000DAABD7A|nr:hypothetical protein [Curtobacterium sp. MCSS17_015]WIB25341.1 hypothetical protein DEJ18_09720 [Curtobacterium sp. MCSS17_015]
MRPTTSSHPPVGRRELTTVVGITVVFGLVLALWAYVNPSLHGPDELANVDAVIHLAMGQGWPSAGDLHYLQGLLAQNVPAHLPAAVDRPDFAAIVGDGSEDTLVNPMSQHPPTWFLVQAVVAHLLDFADRRWDIVVLGMRLVDVAVMLPVPALVWASVRRATRSPRTAVTATALLLAVPQLAQLGSSVSVWVPVITAGALTTWLAVRVLTGDRSWWTVVALGGALAVGTAMMAGGVIAVPFALLAVLVARNGTGALGRVLRGLVVLAIPAAMTGWWYVVQAVRTGTPQPDPFPAVSMAWPTDESPAPTQFAGAFWNGMSNSFWGLLGRYEWPLSSVLVDSFTVIALTAVVWGGTRRTADRRTMLIAGLFPATALLVVLARDWATYASHLGVTVNQGRFLFPALAALLVVQACAWRVLVERDVVRVRLARAVLVVTPLVAVAALGLLYSGSYEELVFRISAAGYRTLAGSVPYGPLPVVALTAAVAVVGLATLVLAWLLAGRPGPLRRTAPADSTAVDTDGGAATDTGTDDTRAAPAAVAASSAEQTDHDADHGSR